MAAETGPTYANGHPPVPLCKVVDKYGWRIGVSSFPVGGVPCHCLSCEKDAPLGLFVVVDDVDEVPSTLCLPCGVNFLVERWPHLDTQADGDGVVSYRKSVGTRLLGIKPTKLQDR